MKVSVRLMASLRSKLPPDAQKGIAQLDLPTGATVARALEALAISPGQVHVVMLNDVMESDRQRALADGDALVVLPPVAGGGETR
jgi:molybdopterin converting factor small subunit